MQGAVYRGDAVGVILILIGVKYWEVMLFVRLLLFSEFQGRLLLVLLSDSKGW